MEVEAKQFQNLFCDEIRNKKKSLWVYRFDKIIDVKGAETILFGGSLIGEVIRCLKEDVDGKNG